MNKRPICWRYYYLIFGMEILVHFVFTCGGCNFHFKSDRTLQSNERWWRRQQRRRRKQKPSFFLTINIRQSAQSYQIIIVLHPIFLLFLRYFRSGPALPAGIIRPTQKENPSLALLSFTFSWGSRNTGNTMLKPLKKFPLGKLAHKENS